MTTKPEGSEAREAFIDATKLHCAEGEIFGMSREEVARSLLMQAVWMHIDVLGHEQTISTLERFVRYVAIERWES